MIDRIWLAIRQIMCRLLGTHDWHIYIWSEDESLDTLYVQYECYMCGAKTRTEKIRNGNGK